MAKVLIVDDCEEMRELIGVLLLDGGHSVGTAESADQAFEQLAKEPFDLVLCDLVLPLSGPDEDEPESDSAMVGVHCINGIKQRYPHVPVVAISGELVGAPLEGVCNFGAVATLSKPFGRKELNAVVSQALMEASS